MNVRRWIGACLALIVLAGVSSKAQSQDLDWKAFTEKDAKPFFQEITTETKQEMKVMDLTFKQTQKQSFLIEWTPKGEKDGKLTIEQKIAGIKMDLDIGGNKISYDSTKEDQPKNPMTQFFETLKKAKFTLTVDAKTLDVEKVEGLDDLVTDLSKVNKSMEPLLKHILSEKTVKQMADPVLGVAPKDGKIPKDGKWGGEDQILDMGPIGTYVTKTTYKSDGQDEKKKDLHKISVTTSLKYDPPSGDVKSGGLPFKIKEEDSSLKSDKGEGTIYFNTVKGRVESSTLHVEISGSLQVEISGMTTNVSLTQSQDVTLQTFDANPWAKKK